MNRDPLNLPTPALIIIAASSILLLLYISLYAISRYAVPHKPKKKDAYAPSYYEYADRPAFDATEFLAHPTQETIVKERALRNSAQSEFDRMSQETEEQLQRMRTEQDLLKTQRQLQTF